MLSDKSSSIRGRDDALSELLERARFAEMRSSHRNEFDASAGHTRLRLDRLGFGVAEPSEDLASPLDDLGRQRGAGDQSVDLGEGALGNDALAGKCDGFIRCRLSGTAQLRIGTRPVQVGCPD